MKSNSMKSFLKQFIVTGIMLTTLGASLAEAQIQRPRRFSIGVYGGFGADLNVANFLELPTSPVFSPRTGGTNEPAAFAGATTIGTWAAGIVMEYQITDQLNVGLRGAYSVQNSSLLTRSTYRVGRSDGTFDDGSSEFSLVSNVQAVALEPMAGYNLFEGLYVHLGARVNFATGSSYAQKETLITPTDGSFSPNSTTRVRNERTGALPALNNITVAPLVGVSYNINVIDRLVVSPEAFFSYGIMPFVTDLPSGSTWTAHSVRVGVSAKYKF